VQIIYTLWAIKSGNFSKYRGFLSLCYYCIQKQSAEEKRINCTTLPKINCCTAKFVCSKRICQRHCKNSSLSCAIYANRPRLTVELKRPEVDKNDVVGLNECQAARVQRDYQLDTRHRPAVQSHPHHSQTSTE